MAARESNATTASTRAALQSGATGIHSADEGHDVQGFVAFLSAQCAQADKVDLAWLNRTVPLYRTRIRAATMPQLVAAVLADADVMVIAAARDELRRRWHRAEHAKQTTRSR